LIEFNNVSMTYQTGTIALKEVSFSIQDGEFVFIIGRSGAGKSTLIKLLTCEEKPSVGQVLIDDFDITCIRRSLVPYLRRNIGMVFQDFRLIYTKTVFENVAFAMEIIGSSRKTIKRRVPIVLSIVGLRDKASARPGELSGGEQQRVAIARAMVNNPMLILADEPTGNLDPTNSEAVMALLEEINRSGTTVVICTHDRELVDRMKKRVVEIDDGCLVRDDTEGQYVKSGPCERADYSVLLNSEAEGEA
jgi:cell division transport system ATP-binding protein